MLTSCLQTGLNWPRSCAPFEIVVVPGSKAGEDDVRQVYDTLPTAVEGQPDAVIDDRDGTLVQKLKDADLIGYPVIVALGRDWEQEKKVEVQCRRLKFKDSVPLGEVSRVASGLLERVDGVHTGA